MSTFMISLFDWPPIGDQSNNRETEGLIKAYFCWSNLIINPAKALIPRVG